MVPNKIPDDNLDIRVVLQANLLLLALLGLVVLSQM